MINTNSIKAKALFSIFEYWDKLPEFEQGKLVGIGESLVTLYGGGNGEKDKSV